MLKKTPTMALNSGIICLPSLGALIVLKISVAVYTVVVKSRRYLSALDNLIAKGTSVLLHSCYLYFRK